MQFSEKILHSTVPVAASRTLFFNLFFFLTLSLTQLSAADTFSDAEKRQAKAQISANIQNLPVSRQKILPAESPAGEFLSVVNVDLEVTLSVVLDVDDAEQTLNTLIQFGVKWTDKALAWNESDFANVKSVAMDPTSVWTPNVKIVNSISLDNILTKADILEVSSNGSVSTIMPFRLTTVCNLDHTFYPYDTQLCAIRFAPFSAGVNLTLSEVGLVDLSLDQSGTFVHQWKVMSFRKESDTLVVLQITRKSMFYSVCLVLPLLLTFYMNALVFVVPLNSGEKFSYLVSIFIYTSVFVSFFSDVMPRNLNSMPLTLSLAIFVIAESFFVLIITLFIMRRHDARTNRDHDDPLPKKESNHDQSEPREDEELSVQTITPSQKRSSRNDTRKSTKKRTLRSFLPRVYPANDEVQNDGDDNDDGTFNQKRTIVKRFLEIKPESLDVFFFFLIFSLNTVGMAVLYSRLFAA